MKCPICGAGQLVSDTRDTKYIYRGRTLIFPQQGEFCTNCKEGIFSFEEAGRFMAEAKAFCERVDREPLSPAEIKRIRKKLGLTQKEAGRVFGGGIRAFSQYERGVTSHSTALDKLLRLLDNHPELLSEVTIEEAA